MHFPGAEGKGQEDWALSRKVNLAEMLKTKRIGCGIPFYLPSLSTAVSHLEEIKISCSKVPSWLGGGC